MILGTPYRMLGATLTGQFTAEGATLIHGILDALVDPALGEPYGLGPDPNAVCDFIFTFGVLCEACPDGSCTTCIRAEEIRGDDLGIAVVPRTEGEIAIDPTCP